MQVGKWYKLRASPAIPVYKVFLFFFLSPSYVIAALWGREGQVDEVFNRPIVAGAVLQTAVIDL